MEKMVNNSFVQQLYVLPANGKKTTFGKDASLPSLPIPPLSDTIHRYIESVRPFMSSAEEFAEAERVAREFERGEGQELHARLMQRAKGQRNWLEQWWLDGAYLSLREPLIPYYSMTGSTAMEDLNWSLGEHKTIKHASLYSYQLVNLWLLLRRDRMVPTQNADKKLYFSMKQFRQLFNCVRVPGERCDALVPHFKTESEGSCSSHVIVLCRGRIFQVEALDSAGTPISASEWVRQLSIISEACHEKQGPGISMLTCDKRTTWAKNRAYLKGLCPENSSTLHTIESAMFVVVLDDAQPTSESDSSLFSLCGDYKNRWADKSLNIIFYRNGAIGGISDHTAYDGMISVAALYYVYLGLQEMQGQLDEVPRKLSPPQELTVHTDAVIESELQRATVELEANKSLVVIVRDKFSGYGKEFIQSHRLHPDSFVQMALQLAYYRLHGKPASTYETATTRAFYNGRTETLRSCTVEAIDWVKAMLTEGESKVNKKALLQRAIHKHDKLMTEARANAGCDRHLFGLYCVAAEEGRPIPQLFSHPAYIKSGGGGNFLLSTSLVGYTPIGGGVSPMCLHGYGCFYNITPSSLQFTISVWRASHETSASKFFQALNRSFEEIHQVLGPAPSKL